MVQLSSDRFAKYVLHGSTRGLIALAVGVVVAAKLVTAGWPWWAWVPAAAVAVQLTYALLLLVVYGYQKATYQARARQIKQHLRQARDAAVREDSSRCRDR